jgi:hypothetical protein
MHAEPSAWETIHSSVSGTPSTAAPSDVFVRMSARSSSTST